MHKHVSIYCDHISALVSLYHINTDECTHILLNHHFINTYMLCWSYV